MRNAIPFALCFFCLLVISVPAFSQEKNVVNTIGMKFVLIPAGSFTMGCDKNFEACIDDEIPQHEVSITKAFYMGKYEVTQTEWEAVMGNNPSKYKGETKPVENVSWNDAKEFIRKLNEKEGTEKYRLPTEAEWEYAARAGSTTTYSYGNDAGQLGDYAWLDGRSGPHPVGQLQPNKWGLYDMHGNVWEWTEDWYGNYPESSQADPKGPDSGEHRVLRGGAWTDFPEHCRSADRRSMKPGNRHEFIGLRLVFFRDS